MDIHAGKKIAAKKNKMSLSLASYLEIPLVFLKCGGNADTGRVPLKSVLEFYEGKPPSIDGQITKAGLDKVLKSLTWISKIQQFPNAVKLLCTSGIVKFVFAVILTKAGVMQEKLGVPK